MTIKSARSFLAVIFACIGQGAVAAPCAGFLDVDSTSPFCANVEWIRNRGVTLGCSSATAYCPNDTVTRLAMSAFMNRLGTALTPVVIQVETSPGALDIDASPVVCQTSDYAVVAYPRRIYIDLAFMGQATSAVDLAADLVFSTNSGASWQQATTLANRGSVPANGWGNLSNLATRDVAVNESVRLGVRVARVSGTADLTDSRCSLRALVGSRDGSGTPLDSIR